MYSGNDINNLEKITFDLQKYLRNNHFETLHTITEIHKKAQIKNLIAKFLEINNLPSNTGLLEKLFFEIAEYSFLTPWLLNELVEEIDINSWDCVTILMSGGEVKHLSGFWSPTHAINIVRRILGKSEMILDASKPRVNGHLTKNKRITAYCYPLIDRDVGVVASIRNINPQNLTKSDFVANQTATEKMIDFLIDILKYEVSICLSGSTNSGKTTLMSCILSNAIDNDKRLITIEYGVREFNLEKRGENGNITNQVIHLVTSDNEQNKITSKDILVSALTSNPDYICMAEMKDEEAAVAIEAGLTGHTLITTVHAPNASAIPNRLLTLCKRGGLVADDSLIIKMASDAFPILVHLTYNNDKKRRISEICEILDGKINHIFKFDYENKEFIQVGVISETLVKRLSQSYMPQKTIDKYTTLEKTSTPKQKKGGIK